MIEFRAIATVALLLLAGCGHSFQATTPASFVELDDSKDDYDYRATSADGLVIGVRELKHDPKGDEAFWIKVLQDRLRDDSGYALLETRETKSADGVKGTRMRFGHDEKGGKPYLYEVTLFVTPKHLVLVEFGGSKAQFEESGRSLDQFLAGFATR